MVKIFYFAWLRQKIGKNSENITLPDHVKNIADVIDYLCQQSDDYQILKTQNEVINIALNQTYRTSDASVKAGDELAFFPPVTGG